MFRAATSNSNSNVDAHGQRLKLKKLTEKKLVGNEKKIG